MFCAMVRLLCLIERTFSFWLKYDVCFGHSRFAALEFKCSELCKTFSFAELAVRYPWQNLRCVLLHRTCGALSFVELVTCSLQQNLQYVLLRGICNTFSFAKLAMRSPLEELTIRPPQKNLPYAILHETCDTLSSAELATCTPSQKVE